MSTPRLDREEYVEQAYFFRVYRERLEENTPSQEILAAIREEILATTKLPMAIDFLKDEVKHSGKLSTGMAHLPHYFTNFQTFVMECAEAERGRFDQIIGLKILEHEAGYLTKTPTQAGLFVYQFECLARNRLGYDRGLEAIAADPLYDEDWRAWIRQLRRELGAVEFSELIYRRSEHFQNEQRRRKRDESFTLPYPVFFGVQEGRIAKANRGKDPLYMFAALQRQLDYPAVPRQRRRDDKPVIHPRFKNGSSGWSSGSRFWKWRRKANWISANSTPSPRTFRNRMMARGIHRHGKRISSRFGGIFFGNSSL